MPQIEHIEISGLGGIHGKSNQNSIISNRYPAISQMYQRAKRMNMIKYQIDKTHQSQQNYSIPIKHIFNEEDDIDSIIQVFCNSSTLEKIHMQFLYDSQVLKTCLNLRYANPLLVIDFSDSVQLEKPENFTDFINLINKNALSLERLYIGGIFFLEQQLQTISRTLNKIMSIRGKPLRYLEYSHFNLYTGDRTSKPSYSCIFNLSIMNIQQTNLFYQGCDRFMLFLKEFFGTFCDFKEEVFHAQEDFLPEISQVTQILTVRNLITLSYFKDQRYIEVKNFDQENVMQFRLFELFQGNNL